MIDYKLRMEIENLALEFVINEEAKKRLLKIVDDQPVECYECNPPDWKECPFCGKKEGG